MGLGNEAIPLTIALGSPLSGLVLYLYTKSIKKFGSKFTLRVSFAVCIFFMAIITFYGRSLKGYSGKIAIVSFYAFREIYVSLLSSQQWAFIAGTLNKSTASYIVTFSGIVSVASAVGGCSIEQLVGYGGVQALLLTALGATVASSLCAEWAYRWSDVLPVSGHSTTTQQQQEEHKATSSAAPPASVVPSGPISTSTSASVDTVRKRNKLSSTSTEKQPPIVMNKESHAAPDHGTVTHKKKGGFWSDSWNLICKHHLLQVLFVEGILHQMCGNMLNLMFHNGLRSEIADDATRAKMVGRFFATVNITSCSLQCFVLPHILSHATLPDVLRKIPLFVLAAVSLGVVSPGLISVMLGFGTIKVIEYSIMHSASEMIYMPMGHEVRYLGKELIRFFGHKLGKSGSSLVLSALVSHVNPSLSVQSVWGAVLTLTWGGAMFFLSNSITERDREQEEQDAKHAKSSAKHSTHSSFHPDAAQKTRRKARSFSFDQISNRKSSNSQAISRTDVAAGKLSLQLPQADELRPRQSKIKAASSDLPRARRASELAQPSRDATQSLDGPTIFLESLKNLSAINMKTIPEFGGSESSTTTPVASNSANTAVNATSVKPPVDDASEFLDTVTDASGGSPEVSVQSPSARSRLDSLESMQSLSNEFERGDSFSEGHGGNFVEYGMDYDDVDGAGVGYGNEGDGDGDGGDRERDSLGSAGSGGSGSSRNSADRRASWERAQRQRMLHSSQQPVMLRVGSVSVSLSSFNEKAERRSQGSHDS